MVDLREGAGRYPFALDGVWRRTAKTVTGGNSFLR